jgi:hypothetical protein
MTDDLAEDADLVPPAPCCAETAGGPFEWWAHWEADAWLLWTATRTEGAKRGNPRGVPKPPRRRWRPTQQW